MRVAREAEQRQGGKCEHEIAVAGVWSGGRQPTLPSCARPWNRYRLFAAAVAITGACGCQDRRRTLLLRSLVTLSSAVETVRVRVRDSPKREAGCGVVPSEAMGGWEKVGRFLGAQEGGIDVFPHHPLTAGYVPLGRK